MVGMASISSYSTDRDKTRPRFTERRSRSAHPTHLDLRFGGDSRHVLGWPPFLALLNAQRAARAGMSVAADIAAGKGSRFFETRFTEPRSGSAHQPVRIGRNFGARLQRVLGAPDAAACWAGCMGRLHICLASSGTVACGRDRLLSVSKRVGDLGVSVGSCAHGASGVSMCCDACIYR